MRRQIFLSFIRCLLRYIINNRRENHWAIWKVLFLLNDCNRCQVKTVSNNLIMKKIGTPVKIVHRGKMDPAIWLCGTCLSRKLGKWTIESGVKRVRLLCLTRMWKMLCTPNNKCYMRISTLIVVWKIGKTLMLFGISAYQEYIAEVLKNPQRT